MSDESDSKFWRPKAVRISEVIEKLQAIQEKEGDLKVAFGDWDCDRVFMVYTSNFGIAVRECDESVDIISAVEDGERFVALT